MGRKKLIEDNELIKHIDRCFYKELNSNPKKLTASEVSRYLKSLGLDIEPRIINRNEVAMKHIDTLKEQNGFISPSITSIVFKPIDIDEFLKNNTSKEKMRKALVERDKYYKGIADYAATTKSQIQYMEYKYDEAEKELTKLRYELKAAQRKLSDLSVKNKQLINNNRALKSSLESYVYPSIATELLKKEGYLSDDVEAPAEIECIEEKIITADTDIHSFLVRDMADEFDD